MKNRKLLNSSAFVVAMSLVAGIASAEPRTIENRDLSGFDTVRSLGSSDVEIKIGSGFKVEVKADSRDFEKITTEVEDGVLTISRKRNSRRSHDHIVVLVTMPEIKEFQSRGSGDGYITNISATDFKVEQSGSGDVELSGTCANGEFNSRGSGDLEARDFTCDNVDISSRGSGDVEIGAKLEAKIDLTGSGDVELYGSARIVDFRSRGSGSVSQRE